MNAVTASPERFLDEAKALACIHCGLCLSSCPTYLETGNENDSPRGRIYLMRALQEGRLTLGDEAVRHIDLCLGCRACEVACPSGVQYGALLEATRDHVEKQHERSWFQRVLRRVAIEKVFPFPERMELALAPARVVKALGLEKWLPKFLREPLSLIPDKMSGEPLPEFSPADACRRRREEASALGAEATETPPYVGAYKRVGFVRGCVMSVMFGDTNANSVELLNAAGYDVHTPEGQGCCGALYSHGGNLDEARMCARRNIAEFERLNLDAIVINAAGCGSTLKEYGHLLHDDPQWAARAEKFSAKVKDLVEVLRPDEFKPQATSHKPQGKVTYHDACHLSNPQRITKQPRDLVKAVAGGRYVELPETEVCCGSAGSYNLTEPEMAERLQRRKIENILKTGADTVVTTNPGCMLQMIAGLRKAGAGHVRVVHLADYLAESRGVSAD